MEYPEIPGYKILGRLGEGGMATVYLALQEKFNRNVALKVMALHLAPDPSFGDRFQREAHIVAQMSHRNFLPVFDVGRHDDFHYMSMEYLPNGSLKALMAEGLTIQDGLNIAREVASGLHYAASKNFVHRDIKPDNILFREDHSAVICDFGIARQMDSSTQMTVIGTVVGTAYYMSPEQAKAETIDGRSDLYNLGVIIYEMLTGQVPYDADSALAVSIKHVSEEIPLLPERLEAFQGFIDKALAKHPDDRFQTGQAMIDALDDLEEREFELVEDLSTTVVMSPVAPSAVASSRSADADPLESATVLQPQSGLHAKRTGSISRTTGKRRRLHGRTGQRARRRKSERSGSRKLGWALAAVSLLAVGGFGYWYVSHPRMADTPEIVHTLDGLLDRSSNVDEATVIRGTVSEKSRDLNRQALEAMKENRLYAPEKNNAQYFLTTLLALYPGDVDAREGIAELYQTYLQRAEDAIDEGDFDLASDFLNQSSQISYYISDEGDIEQQSKLRNQLIVAQQQDIIAKERVADIESLLLQGAERFEAGKLTTPPGDNAFDTYQQVLSLAPANQQASDGIREIAGGFLLKAKAQAEVGDYAMARASMAAAAQIFPRHPEMESVRDQVVALEQKSLAGTGDTAINEGGGQAAEGEPVVPQATQRVEIEQLLNAAEEDIVAYRLSSPSDNNALQKYNSILELDPTSEPALQGIEDVAIRYVQMAQTGIADDRLEEAARYLEQAGKISPTNAEYVTAQNALIAAQELATTDRAADEEIDEQVTALLERAQSDIMDDRIYSPAENNAMLKLRQVLELDAENADALQQQEELMQGIFATASDDISSGELEEAQRAIDYLAGNNADSEHLQALRDQLEAAAPVDTMSLLTEARALGGPRGVDSGSYRALADIYLQVLEAQPGNPEAQEGLALASQYAADLAANSIRMGRFSIAESQLGYLEEMDPAYPRLPELRAAIADEKASPIEPGTQQFDGSQDGELVVGNSPAPGELENEPGTESAEAAIGEVLPQPDPAYRKKVAPEVREPDTIENLF